MAKLLYSAPGMNVNDSWYAYADEKYYAYYLQYPQDADPAFKWDSQSVGVSVSEDLEKWEYLGTALEPEKGTFFDRGIATGSSVLYNGRHYMLFTGNSFEGNGGFGLAESSDMLRYSEAIGKPVILKKKSYFFPYRGEKLECTAVADPYIYPEKVGEYFYVFMNCYAIRRKIGQRGCIAVFRTRDLIEYEPYSVAVQSDIYDRLETPQVFFKDGKWLMYVGAVKSEEKNGSIVDLPERDNIMLVGDSLTGEYSACKGTYISLPDGSPFYIAKSVTDKKGNQRFIVNNYPTGAYGNYTVKYSEDDGIKINYLTEEKK